MWLGGDQEGFKMVKVPRRQKKVLTRLLYGYCPTTGWFLRQAGAALMTVSWVYVSHDYSPTNTSWRVSGL